MCPTKVCAILILLLKINLFYFSNRSSSMASRVTVQCLTPWPPAWTQPPESAISRCTHSWLTKRMYCLTRQRFMDRSWRDKSISGRTLILSSTRRESNFISCNSNVPERCVLFKFCSNYQEWFLSHY